MTLIYYEDLPVAHLSFEGEWRLTYDASWEARRAAFPISLTMPLHAGPIGSDKLMPWLANLLPETHLAQIGQRLKVSPQDIVGLLQHIGRDTAGALSIGAPRKPGIHLAPVPDEIALERIINALPEKPFLAGEHGVSMSLAGVQEKLPVYLDAERQISIPIDGTPSTHILKPDASRLAGSVENEAFCLHLACACGLEAAEATIGRAGDRRYLLVKRYDRFTDPYGVLRRLHQEDFCQLTGHFPSEKYELTAAGNGVALHQMFNILSDLISPSERLKFLDAVVFNILICNADSHAKNYSILIGANGSARLAPLYDLMCAAVYENVDQHLPQTIGDKTLAAELHVQDWNALAREAGLSPASTIKRIEELADIVATKIDEATIEIARLGDPSRIIEQAGHEIKKRCRRILRQLRPERK